MLLRILKINSLSNIDNICKSKNMLTIFILQTKHPNGPKISKLTSNTFIFKYPKLPNETGEKELASIRKSITFLILDLIKFNKCKIHSIYVNDILLCGLSALFLSRELNVPLYSFFSSYEIKVGFFVDNEFSILNEIAINSTLLIVNTNQNLEELKLLVSEYGLKTIIVYDSHLDKRDYNLLIKRSKNAFSDIPWKRKKEPSIYVSNPYITGLEKKYVNEVIDSKWWGYGPVSKYLETQLENYLENKVKALATINCTAAIHLALMALDIKQHDEIILPNMTFISTLAPILYQGAVPCFADIEDQTLNIDPKSVESLITKKTRAIIPVHFAGLPCNLDKLYSLIKGKNISIIEDAAHALGSSYKSKKIGSISKFTCFSFAPTKSICSSTGGMLLYKSKSLDRKLRSVSEMGLRVDTYNRSMKNGIRPANKIEYIGYRYRQNDISAAIATAQLSNISQISNLKNSLAKRYYYNLSSNDSIRLLEIPSYSSPNWYIMPIRVPGKLRNKLRQHLIKNNIDSSIHYPLLPHQNLFKKYKSHCNVANKEYRKLITLPLHNNLTLKQIDDISEIVDKFIRKHS